LSAEQKRRGESGWSLGRRRLGGAICLLLAAASLAHYTSDLRLREPADRFVRRFSLDRRHPLEVAAMRLEPSGDLACGMAVDTALAEEPSGKSSGGLSPQGRSAGPPAVDRPEELTQARDLMLNALKVRPGWPFHAYLLGRAMAEPSMSSRGLHSSLRSELWAVPLRRATAAAPGVDAIAEARAAAYLDTWPHLDAALREEAPSVLRRAFLNPDFVSRQFGAAVGALDIPKTLPLLPEAAKPLRAAIKALSRAGDIPSVMVLYGRLQRAERSERADDLRKVEKRERLADLEGKRTACWNWISAHSIADFDDAPARAEVARLLELWPDDQGGAWSSDPRAELVGFFLNGRQHDARGEALARAVEALAGVPSSVRARAKILAGDESGALELAEQAEADPIEWTPFFMDLARFEMRQGKPAQARAALERFAPTALEDCEVLLVRRELARMLADGRELESVGQKLMSTAATRESWSAGGTLSICLDPTRTQGRVLAVAVQSEAPAVVSYGWDGGRSGIVLVSKGEGILRIPLGGIAGRRSLWIKALAGGPIQPGRAALEPAS
jgi:hypothetical protein